MLKLIKRGKKGVYYIWGSHQRTPLYREHRH